MENINKNENSGFSLKNIVLKYNVWILYSLSLIFFIISLFFLIQANDYMEGTAQLFGDSYSKMPKRYVGGDAYNFIIAGTYSTTLTLRALIFTVLSVGFLISGKIASLKK